MAFENYQPPRYWIVAEITKGYDKDYRYRVHGSSRIDTLEDAKEAIKVDIRANANPNTFGGLIDWGKSDPREYAIYDLRTGERVY